MEQRPAEYCCQCDALTGHAGPEEDSLTTSYGEGSYCAECWDKLWAEQDRHQNEEITPPNETQITSNKTQSREPMSCYTCRWYVPGTDNETCDPEYWMGSECMATHYDNLRSFPFKLTICKHWRDTRIVIPTEERNGTG